MKLVVLGATGETGLQIVRRALEHSHSVTAFVRSPARLQPYGDRVAIREGDLLNSAELEQVLKDHDAVVSGFGPRSPVSGRGETVWQRFALALTKAMADSGVRRAVVMSTSFLFRNSVLPPAYLVGRLFFPGVVADAREMERTFIATNLDWTILRPPRLTNEAHSGKYRVCEGRLPLMGFRVSRADVADCMVQLVNNRSSTRKIIGISQ